MKNLIIIAVLLISAAGGDIHRGYATWYDESWVKDPMASGLMFDKRRLEAAHRTLPFGTVCKVTSARTKKSVEVVITDRGPCAQIPNKAAAKVSHRGCPEPRPGMQINRDRIIDLTPVAAEQIGMINIVDGKYKEISGVTKVSVEILEQGTCKSWGSCKKRPFKRGKIVE